MFNVYAVEPTKRNKRTAPQSDDEKRTAALRALAACIQAKRRAIEVPAVSRPDVWAEYVHLDRQFDAVSALENWPVNFTDLPIAEQRAAQIEVAIACIEHAPASSRILRAARLDWENDAFACYQVPSESSAGTLRPVTVDKSTLDVHCDCPGHTGAGHCWHGDAALHTHALLFPIVQRSLITLDNLTTAAHDRKDGLEDARPVKPGHEPRFGGHVYGQTVCDYTKVFAEVD